MKINSKVLLYLAISLPLIILLAMSFVPLMTYFFGETIYLETIPVDPWDPFRGEYVSLNFEINEVPKSKFPEELRYESTYDDYKNKDLYAVLKQEGDYFVVDHMSFTKPDHQYYLWADIPSRTPLNNQYSNTVYVEYPIDRYFVPENTGIELEELSRKGELKAEVKVWKGYPLLIDVYPKGE